MNYYYTDGETGSLISTGYTSENITEGLDISGWYIRPGKPPANYTEKTSAFDLWDTNTLSWITNPNQVSLEAKLEAERLAFELQIAITAVLAKRNQLLAASDWTQLPDVPLTTKESWAAYRQSLRDITLQAGYPLNVVWPTPPQ